jgi:hypothetical protein
LKEKTDQIKQKLKFNQSSLSINKNFSTLKDKTNLNADKIRKKIIPDSNDAPQNFHQSARPVYCQLTME